MSFVNRVLYIPTDYAEFFLLAKCANVRGLPKRGLFKEERRKEIKKEKRREKRTARSASLIEARRFLVP